MREKKYDKFLKSNGINIFSIIFSLSYSCIFKKIAPAEIWLKSSVSNQAIQKKL